MAEQYGQKSSWVCFPTKRQRDVAGEMLGDSEHFLSFREGKLPGGLMTLSIRRAGIWNHNRLMQLDRG